MSVESASLDGVQSLTTLLQRVPQGTAARSLAERLGLWSTSVHSQASQRRKAFPTNFSSMSDQDISDANAYWISEVFRSTELVGLLEGQRTVLTLQSKSTRASTRAQLRRNHRLKAQEAVDAGKPAPKDPAATQLADEVEEDTHVQEQDQTLVMVAVVLESAKAYKEACLAAAQGVSREISFRQAQMGARLRG